MILGVPLTTLLLWALFGFGVGFLVSAIDSHHVRGGILGTAVLGILGAFVGGFFSTILFGETYIGLSIPGVLTAVVGGLLISFIYRLLFRQGLPQ